MGQEAAVLELALACSSKDPELDVFECMFLQSFMTVQEGMMLALMSAEGKANESTSSQSCPSVKS